MWSVVLGAVALGLAATGSWIPSLWGDEATSVMSATRPLGSLAGMLTRVDAVHGLYYFALHGWIEVFGSSPFAVRFPSAVGVGVATAAVVWLCGRVAGLPTAVLAGVFTAVLPRMTYAGEEARSYAFDAAIAAVLCAVVVEILIRRPTGRRWWVAYAAIIAAGTYAFLYLGLMALPAGIAIVAHRPTRALWRRWAVATGAGLACAAPLVVFAALERNQIAYLAHTDAVTPASLLVQTWFGRPGFAVAAWALILVAIAGYVIGLRRRPRPAEDVRLEPLMIAWLFVPVGVLVAVSPFIADFTSRYGTIAAPAAAVLMALGVHRIVRVLRRRVLRRRVLSAAVAGVVAVAVVAEAAPIWAAQRTPYAKNGSDWNQIAAIVSKQARPDDAIVFDAAAHPSRRPRLALDTDPRAFRGVDDVLLRTPYARAAYWWDDTYSVTRAAALGRFSDIDRVWVVEYDPNHVADAWGLSPLEAMGFRPDQRIRLHSSEIVVLARPEEASATGLTP